MYTFTNKLDFYITNVCNLTCDHCNRFNNHDFRGWQKWDDYADTYKAWGKLISIESATIMGGEPFLNNTLTDWINGINQIFDIEVQVLTNGTRFRNAPPGLYDALSGYISPTAQAKNHIGVSLHRLDDEDEILENIKSFLGPGVKIAPKGQNPWNSDWYLVDDNDVKVNVYKSTEFNKSAIIPLVPDSSGKKRFTLHNSDPELAHDICSFANFKSYHFIKGALYKCAPAHLFKEFDEQYQFEITEQQRYNIHNGYTPLTVDNFHTHLPEWIEMTKSPIPQCELCPSNYETHSIFPIRKNAKKSL